MSGPRITEMYAFICLDETEDTEGIPAFSGPSPDGSGKQMFMPLVGADEARVKALMPIAQQMVKATGKKIRFVRFTNMEELGEVSAHGLQ